MRSFLRMCVVALIASAQFASAAENFSLFSDNKCSTALGTNPVSITLPESASCYSAGTLSFINKCVSDSKTESVDVRLWSSSGTCAGTPDASYVSTGTAKACNAMTISSGDIKISCYVKDVSCTTSEATFNATSTIHDIDHLVQYVQVHQQHPRKRFNA